jgi:hypothetical protein
MSELDVERMLNAMTKRQRQAVTDYARRRAAGEPIPAEVKKTAARVVCLTVSTTLLERALRADERDVVLAAICDALQPEQGEGV